MKTYIVVYWLYNGGYCTNIGFHAKNDEEAIKKSFRLSQGRRNDKASDGWNREKCNLYSLETGKALAEHGEGQKNCWSFIPPKRKTVH